MNWYLVNSLAAQACYLFLSKRNVTHWNEEQIYILVYTVYV